MSPFSESKDALDPPDAEESPRGLYFLADLLNTVREPGGATAAEIEAVVEAHGGPPLRLTDSAAQEVRGAAAIITGVLDIQDEDEAATALNALLERHSARPRLVRLPGRRWSLHAQPPENAGPAEWVLTTTVLALALWLSERGYCAWGCCAAPGCGRYFIDTGRRARQRYCSTRCGTRVRVAAHRSRTQ